MDEYPNWEGYGGNGGDCANFVLQCLYAGGKEMRGTDATAPRSWFSFGTASRDLSSVTVPVRIYHMRDSY